jgi:hypothetical protein
MAGCWVVVNKPVCFAICCRRWLHVCGVFFFGQAPLQMHACRKANFRLGIDEALLCFQKAILLGDDCPTGSSDKFPRYLENHLHEQESLLFTAKGQTSTGASSAQRVGLATGLTHGQL